MGFLIVFDYCFGDWWLIKFFKYQMVSQPRFRSCGTQMDIKVRSLIVYWLMAKKANQMHN